MLAKKWRLLVDKCPIPNIDDILGKLGAYQYFKTLDLAKSFHQIEIDRNDIHKISFSIENSFYEFFRMPFGLKTVPATFQRLINNVLKDYIHKKCLVYLYNTYNNFHNVITRAFRFFK